MDRFPEEPTEGRLVHTGGGMKRIVAIIGAIISLNCGEAAKKHSNVIASEHIEVQAMSDWVILDVFVFHDDTRKVTCWSTYRGLSCLPDSQVGK